MSKILYVDFDPASDAVRMKISGIRRRLAFCGMDVETLPLSASRPKDLMATLSRLKPDGCIVECSLGNADLPPRFFGALPVVYLDGRSSLYGGKMLMVVHDGAATARGAFKILMKTRPSCLAVVGWKEKVFWSSLREKTFAARSREADMPVVSFDAVGTGGRGSAGSSGGFRGFPGTAASSRRTIWSPGRSWRPARTRAVWCRGT